MPEGTRGPIAPRARLALRALRHGRARTGIACPCCFGNGRPRRVMGCRCPASHKSPCPDLLLSQAINSCMFCAWRSFLPTSICGFVVSSATGPKSFKRSKREAVCGAGKNMRVQLADAERVAIRRGTRDLRDAETASGSRDVLRR